MVAFVQPFSLDGKAGGARILRTLVESAPEPCLSVNTAVGNPPDAAVGEIHVPGRPVVPVLDRFARIQRLVTSNLDVLYGGDLENRLVTAFKKNGVTAVHAIPHGIDFWYAFRAARKIGVPFFLNVHDELYYNLYGVPYLSYAVKRLAEVWRNADGVFVISEVMGEEYCRRYGQRDYTIVTDGLTQVASQPRSVASQSRRVYMMGSAHMSYRENFRVLFEGLSLLKDAHPDWNISLTIRGGFPYDVQSSIPLIQLPWGTQEEVESDLDEVDLLYMPLPFEERHAPLARFSMATKLITYLGSGLPILFHGPEYAAACRLLRKYDAATIVDANEAPLLASTITDGTEFGQKAANALHLARTQFMASHQRSKFWSVLGSSHVDA